MSHPNQPTNNQNIKKITKNKLHPKYGRQSLVQHLSEQQLLSKNDAHDFVDGCLYLINKALLTDFNVSIKKFGKFHQKLQGAKKNQHFMGQLNEKIAPHRTPNKTIKFKAFKKNQQKPASTNLNEPNQQQSQAIEDPLKNL